METKRFEFPGDNYWEVYQEMTWGTKRAMRHISYSFMKLDKASVNGAGELVDAIIDVEKWDDDAVNEVLLLHSTVGWSYGPISSETFAKIPLSHAQRVLAYVNEVYPKTDPLVNGHSESALLKGF